MHIRYINATLKAQLYRLLLVVNLLAAFGPCFGTITISPVNTTSSTCPNNGTATIHATSNLSNAILYYAIGPDYVWRNDSTFTSLYPGTYTARVYDLNSADSAQVSFTITGNYQLPNILTQVTPILCNGTNNGVITCVADSNTGRLPYTWEITSPMQVGPLGNNVFNLLPADTYTIRMTDACQNIQIRTAIVPVTGTGLSSIDSNPLVIEPISCNAFSATIRFLLNPAQITLPVTLQVTTNSGTYTKHIMPTSGSIYLNGKQQCSITDTVYNITYGQPLRMCVTDTCNIQICSSTDSVPPFRFIPIFETVTNSCVVNYYVRFHLPGINFTHKPVHLTLVNQATNTTIINDSLFVDFSYQYAGPLQSGTSYLYTITDLCGNTFQSTKTVPSPSPPALVLGPTCQPGVLDSTGTCRLTYLNFNGNVTVQILSGPTKASSNTPKFAYNDTIIYPRTLTGISSTIYIYNLPLGTYQIRVSDNCGQMIDTAFSITTVAAQRESNSFQPGCGGIGSWKHDVQWPCYADIRVKVKLGYSSTQVPVVITNGRYYTANGLAPGIYTSSIDNYRIQPNEYALFGPSSWNTKDTLIIAQPSNVLIKSHTIIQCHGQIYLHIQPDSTNGTPPFKYEIISGPQTFPLQNSGLFNLPTIGTYLTRVIDSCGNSNTLQTTTDTAYVEPVVVAGNLCVGNTVKLIAYHSPYYKYIWQRPTGGTYVGDTLPIQPFSMADTGNYFIKKVVYINNCTDTLDMVYHLNHMDMSFRTDTMCQGSTLHIGHYSHSVSGAFIDTLLNQTGCDSLVFLNLTIMPLPIVVINPAQGHVCYGQSSTITATGGYRYFWNTGSTMATIGTGVLTNNHTYLVTVTSAYGCSVIASSTFNIHLPLQSITASTTQLCAGGQVTICSGSIANTTFSWSNGATDSCISVNASGNYRVTFTDAYGCTAQSNTLVITSSSLQSANISASNNSICATDSAQLCAPAGLAGYLWNNGSTQRCIWVSQAGNYYVTVTNSSGCSVESNHLAIDVLPSPQVSISISRDTLTPYSAQAYQWYLNGSPISGATNEQYVVTQPGNYQVQVTDTNGCSSISNPVVFTGMPGSLLYSEALVYPNPSNGLFTVSISSPQSEKVQLRITNLLGELTGQYEFEKTSGTFNKQINLSTVPKGLYILQISIAGKILNRKIEID